MKYNFHKFLLTLESCFFLIGNISPTKLSEPSRQLGLIGMMIGAGEISGIFPV